MYRINETCPWVARRGLLAQIVECPEGYQKYPFSSKARDEVVVLIPEDAVAVDVGQGRFIAPEPRRLDGHDIWWSCVMSRFSLDEVDDEV